MEWSLEPNWCWPVHVFNLLICKGAKIHICGLEPGRFLPHHTLGVQSFPFSSSHLSLLFPLLDGSPALSTSCEPSPSPDRKTFLFVTVSAALSAPPFSTNCLECASFTGHYFSKKFKHGMPFNFSECIPSLEILAVRVIPFLVWCVCCLISFNFTSISLILF